jgi:hypothetical protein
MPEIVALPIRNRRIFDDSPFDKESTIPTAFGPWIAIIAVSLVTTFMLKPVDLATSGFIHSMSISAFPAFITNKKL